MESNGIERCWTSDHYMPWWDTGASAGPISFWKGPMIKAFFDVYVHDPRQIEENGKVLGDDTMQKMLLVVSSAKEAIDNLQVYLDAGFTEIVITNSSPERQKMVKLHAREVIPQFR
jgi:coenzyme F420-dependent glucose-6-phosphate dehydrogenase